MGWRRLASFNETITERSHCSGFRCQDCRSMHEWIILTMVVISGHLALGMSLFAAAARGDRGLLEPQTDNRSATSRPLPTARPTMGGVA
jgi:hypothetical protein